MSIGIMVELSVKDIARTIKKLSKAEKEELALMLSGQDKEIIRRLGDIKSGKTITLTRKEILRNAV